MRKQNDDRQVKILAALILVAMFAALLAVRWAILTYTPCSVFTVAEAPVRCLK